MPTATELEAARARLAAMEQRFCYVQDDPEAAELLAAADAAGEAKRS